MRVIISFILSLVTMMTLTSGIILPMTAYAANAGKDSACSALNQIGTAQGCGSNDSTNIIPKIVKVIVRTLSLLLGAIAVIMVIIAGFKYITSNGDSNAISSAKNTLVYALVGLVIAALAQFIVRFVVNRATS